HPSGQALRLRAQGACGERDGPRGQKGLRMSDLFTEPVLTALIAGALLSMMPIMLAALGESISEQAGVLNVGLEGMMLFGAYAGFNAAYYLHSSWLGMVA